jgi:hypothetical protein
LVGELKRSGLAAGECRSRGRDPLVGIPSGMVQGVVQGSWPGNRVTCGDVELAANRLFAGWRASVPDYSIWRACLERLSRPESLAEHEVSALDHRRRPADSTRDAREIPVSIDIRWSGMSSHNPSGTCPDLRFRVVLTVRATGVQPVQPTSVPKNRWFGACAGWKLPGQRDAAAARRGRGPGMVQGEFKINTLRCATSVQPSVTPRALTSGHENTKPQLRVPELGFRTGAPPGT